MLAKFATGFEGVRNKIQKQLTDLLDSFFQDFSTSVEKSGEGLQICAEFYLSGLKPSALTKVKETPHKSEFHKNVIAVLDAAISKSLCYKEIDCLVKPHNDTKLIVLALCGVSSRINVGKAMSVMKMGAKGIGTMQKEWTKRRSLLAEIC